MSRDGSGNYSLYAGNPVVTGATINSTLHNNTMNDIATALTASIAKDGQTVPSADLPMGTYKHTGVGNAAARTQYAAAGQVQDGTLEYLTSVSGADTITATAAVSMAAYAAGQTFRFIAAGANTGAVTININAIGAKAITKNGTTALAAGDIPSGATVEVVYDGTRFQMIGCVANKAQAGANTDITSLAGLTTPLAAAYGGTGRATLALAVQALLDEIGATEGDLLYFDGSDWAVLAAGTTGQALLMGATAPEWATRTRIFESSIQTISAAGLVTVAHSLGARPIILDWVYECINADQGWTTGELVKPELDSNPSGYASHVLYADATNIYARFNNTYPMRYMAHKTTGVGFLPSVSNWGIRLIAAL